MGWISRRKMQTGHGLNDRRGVKIEGVLKLITCVRVHAESIFDYALVDLECGHTGRSYARSPIEGVTKARCKECKKEV